MIIAPNIFSLDKLNLRENEIDAVKKVIGNDSDTIIAEKYGRKIVIAVNGSEYINENNALGFIGDIVDKYGRIIFIKITDTIRVDEKPPFEHLIAVSNMYGDIEFEIQDYFGKVVESYKLVDIYNWSKDKEFKVIVDSVRPVTKRFRTPWKTTVKMYTVHVNGKVLVDGYEIPLDTDVSYRSAFYSETLARAKMERWVYAHVYTKFIKIFEMAQEVYQQGYLDKNIETLKNSAEELVNMISKDNNLIFKNYSYFNSKVHMFVNKLLPYLPRFIEIDGSEMLPSKFFFMSVAESVINNFEKLKNNSVINRGFTKDLEEEFKFYLEFKDKLPRRIKGLILNDALAYIGLCYGLYP